MEEVEEILRSARAAGAVKAEVYLKTSRGRRVILEPGLVGGRPRITVSAFVEEGMAIRVLDREGRSGFAWGSPAGVRRAAGLAEAALAACSGSAVREGCGPSGAIPFPPPAQGPLPDLGMDDPETAGATDDRLVRLLGEAVDAATAGPAADVDRAVLSTAATRITLANSLGFMGEYPRTLAHLSVSMAPAVAGARAALEERAACRLRDLDPRDCGLEAARRSLPPRPLVPPPAGELPAILSPRAAASLLRALLPWILQERRPDLFPDGGQAQLRPSRRGARPGGLTVIDDPRLPGRPGSAPFDGAGQTTGRTILLDGGRFADRLSAEGGNAIRASFKDPPVIGPSNIYIAPDGGHDPGALQGSTRGIAFHDVGAGGGWDGPCLRIAAARFDAGPRIGIEIVRGDWHTPAGPAGPADGLYWSGPLQAVLEGVAAAGSDLRFFHPGAVMGAPSLRLEGIGPWVAQGTAVRPAPGAAARPEPGTAARPEPGAADRPAPPAGGTV
jgi:predicted Zn-dependent protease